MEYIETCMRCVLYWEQKKKPWKVADMESSKSRSHERNQIQKKEAIVFRDGDKIPKSLLTSRTHIGWQSSIIYEPRYINAAHSSTSSVYCVLLSAAHISGSQIYSTDLLML